mgnify:CR=1 FL=1
MCSSDLRPLCVVGRRNEVRVFLVPAFGRQEVVIAAAPTRIFAAGLGPRRVDGAAAFLGVEEAADAPEDRIGLAAHGVFLVAIHFGELLARGLEAEAEMLGQPFDVGFGERNERIGTAIAGAFEAIVLGHRNSRAVQGSSDEQVNPYRAPAQERAARPFAPAALSRRLAARKRAAASAQPCRTPPSPAMCGDRCDFERKRGLARG